MSSIPGLEDLLEKGVFLPGKSHRQKPGGLQSMGHKESDMIRSVFRSINPVKAILSLQELEPQYVVLMSIILIPSQDLFLGTISYCWFRDYYLMVYETFPNSL